MRFRRPVSIWVLLLVLAIAVPPLRAADAETSAAELERLRARITELDQALGKDRERETGLKAELTTAEQSLAQAASASRAAARDLAQQDRRAQDAAKAQARAAQALLGSRLDLARALRAAYMAGSPGPLQLLFRVDDAEALSRSAVDSAALARAMADRLAAVRTQLAQLAQADAELAREREQIELRKTAASKALAELRRAQDGRRERLDELSKRSRDRAGELKQAQSEAVRMQKLIEGLRRALREQPPSKFERGVPLSSLRGRLPWPLRGELLARYGQSKAGGALNWSGIWIKGEEGAPVRAVADGRVIYVGWVQRFGLMVILDHPGEYLSLYGHLRDSSVEVGESVPAGSALAAAGNSGGHEESGLYFEIRKGTEPVDPSRWLAR